MVAADFGQELREIIALCDLRYVSGMMAEANWLINIF
jgi:hypothetical protein